MYLIKNNYRSMSTDWIFKDTKELLFSLFRCSSDIVSVCEYVWYVCVYFDSF